MENYSPRLVKRIWREKEKQEWANSHIPITSKIKFFIFLTFAVNTRVKLVVAAVAFIIQLIWTAAVSNMWQKLFWLLLRDKTGRRLHPVLLENG